MDYLTRHYRHLCEQLQEKINVLEKFLIEKPSIEDQIETAEKILSDFEQGRSQTSISVPKSNVSVVSNVGTETLRPTNLGNFRYNSNKLTTDYLKQGRAYPSIIELNKNLVDPETNKLTSLGRSTLAHEGGGHGHQYAAQARDVAAGKNVNPAGHELKASEKNKIKLQAFEKKGLSPSDIKQREYASYRFDPQEVNARSLEGSHKAYDFAKKELSFDTFIDSEHRSNFAKNNNFRNAVMNLGVDKALQDTDVSAPSASRHERSQLKRQKILANKDARSSVARGIQKAINDEGANKTFGERMDTHAAKERMANINQKVAAMRERQGITTSPTVEPKTPKSSPEVVSNATSVKGKVAGAVLDPVSAATSAITTQASKVAPKFSVKPISASSLASGAAYLGAGTVGSIIGSTIVEPAAEKLGVFDAVEKGSKKAFSKMPDWAVKASDKALGAAQVALDPIGSAFSASVDMRSKQQDRMRKSGMSEDEIAQSMASSIQ